MSNQRPYTAVLCSASKTQIVEVNASVDFTDAQIEVSEKYPAWNVVALLAGSHASRSRSFDRATRRPVTADKYIDPFDTQID